MNKELRKMITRNRTMILKSLERSSPVKFQALYIETTRYCNRACSHCFAGEFNNSDMDPELIKNIIEFSYKNNVFSVIFAGLEPLARFNTTVAPFITDSRFKDMYFMIHTNGDFLSDKIADEIDKANNTIIQLSLDGIAKKNHDDSKGKNSYKNTIKAVGLLKERGVPYGFFVTCTSKNFSKMKEIVQHAIDLGATSLHIVGYKAIGPKANLNLMLNAEQERIRYKLKDDTKKLYPYLSIPKRGCNIGVNKKGFFSYCPFLLQYASGPQITSKTEHSKILELFQQHEKEFSEIMSNTIDCPLIERPLSFTAYAEKASSIEFNDMVKKGSPTHINSIYVSSQMKKSK